MCYYTYFIPKDKEVSHKLLQGSIYDIEKSTGFTSIKTSDEVIFTDKKFPTLNVYSELSLPDTFIAKKVQVKTAADYILVSDKLLKRKYVFKPVVVSQQKKKAAKQSKPSRKAKKVKPKEKTSPDKSLASLNYYTLKNIVKESEKTYFYTDVKTGLSHVELELVSFTPYKDKGILKLSLNNNSKQYFFVATVNITKQNDKIPSDFFGTQFVAPNNSQVLYVLMRDLSIKKRLILNVIESGGRERWLKIKYSFP